MSRKTAPAAVTRNVMVPPSPAVYASASGDRIITRPHPSIKTFTVPCANATGQTLPERSLSQVQELREMLTLLRDDSAAESAPAVSYEPARGLADLEAQVATYRSAGLPVRTDIEGGPRALSPSADLCAYRIIQEALTNTLKHAGRCTAIVRLHYRGDSLQGHGRRQRTRDQPRIRLWCAVVSWRCFGPMPVSRWSFGHRRAHRRPGHRRRHSDHSDHVRWVRLCCHPG